MGREISIEKAKAVYDENNVLTKLDLLKDEDLSRFICGRTDFTNALSNYFYNNDDVCFIFVTEDKDLIGKKFAIGTHESHSKETFYCCGVSKGSIFATVDEYANIEKHEWQKANDAYEDLRAARRNTTKIDDFRAFSDAMDGVENWLSDYSLTANNFGSMLESTLKELTDKEFAVIVLSE